MLGNQCTALIKALTSCLYRKQSVTRSLLISCRSQSVCEIVLPIKTCLSMTTSARMRPYRDVTCCLRASAEIQSARVMNVAHGNKSQSHRNGPITDGSAGWKTRLHRLCTKFKTDNYTQTHTNTHLVFIVFLPSLFSVVFPTAETWSFSFFYCFWLCFPAKHTV